MLNPIPGLEVDEAKLREACRRHRIVKLELFGSRAKGTARPDSDVDLLVTYAVGHEPGIEYWLLPGELSAVFGLRAHVSDRDAIEHSPNKYVRLSILGSAQPLYHAA